MDQYFRDKQQYVAEQNGLETLRLAGLNPAKKEMVKALELEIDRCCEQNFGCDGCYQYQQCWNRWAKVCECR